MKSFFKKLLTNFKNALTNKDIRQSVFGPFPASEKEVLILPSQVSHVCKCLILRIYTRNLDAFTKIHKLHAFER